MSTNIRGCVVPAGKVYLCRAVRRVDVSSTRMPVDCKRYALNHYLEVRRES